MAELTCIETCYVKGYFEEGTTRNFEAKRAKELLATGYFVKTEEVAPTPKPEPSSGPRKKITVK